MARFLGFLVAGLLLLPGAAFAVPTLTFDTTPGGAGPSVGRPPANPAPSGSGVGVGPSWDDPRVVPPVDCSRTAADTAYGRGLPLARGTRWRARPGAGRLLSRLTGPPSDVPRGTSLTSGRAAFPIRLRAGLGATSGNAHQPPS